MSEEKNSKESRRKLLKSLAAGSGVVIAGKSLPASWSRPVVDSVMLPAHAQTSQTPQTVTYALGLAQNPSEDGHICITYQEGGSTVDIDLWFLVSSQGGDLSVFQAMGVPVGPTTPVPMTLINQSCGYGDTCTVYCTSVNGVADGVFEFDLDQGSVFSVPFSAPVAPCIDPPVITCVGGGLGAPGSLRGQ